METIRLLLRIVVKEDAERIAEIRNSDFVMQYNVMKKLTVEEIQEEIEHRKGSFYAIELKQSHQVIGIINISEDHMRYGVAAKCLSYYLDEAYTKQGYMKEALARIVDYLFSIDIDVVSARVFKNNLSSSKLLTSLGFIHEGTLRHCVKGIDGTIHDDLQFSIIKEK